MTQSKLSKSENKWPIDHNAATAPKGWTGWPDGKKFALVFMFDVETAKGQTKCRELHKLTDSFGFKSAFNFVAKRYDVSLELLQFLKSQGCEIGVHGLYHDGKLYKNKKIFMQRAEQINETLKQWNSVGFRSPSMHNNLEWIHNLNIEYDSSTFDTDLFEPQSEGVFTIFPFKVCSEFSTNTYIELPYTLPQDCTLFTILQKKNIDIWKKKLDWIVEQGGMALFTMHPDYMNFKGGRLTIDEYPYQYYNELLTYIKTRYKEQYWTALPREVAELWRERKLNNENNAYKEVNLNEGEKTIEPRSNNKTEKLTKKRPIWIDLDNSPHVVFFKPIIEELKEQGYNTVLSARDCFQVCGLAKRFNLKYTRLGRHYGKNKVMKVFGTLLRAIMLVPFALKHRPALIVSHGSRSQLIASKLLGIPSILMYDYEHTTGIPLVHPTYSIAPSVVTKNVSGKKKGTLLSYPGIKEDVYVPNFKPDPSIKEEFKLSNEDLVVTIRPPATEAHYHVSTSEVLFEEILKHLTKIPNVRIFVLPRSIKQNNKIKEQWKQWVDNGKIIIPDTVVDGLNIIWYSDLVISGGGTMNREAAAMGVPVYTIFKGKTGAVDRFLARKGKLTFIETVEDIKTKIKFVKWSRPSAPGNANKSSLNTIVDHIKNIFDKKAR